MNLKEMVRNWLREKKKELNPDTFGEIMDEFIRESACEMVIHKEEGADFFQVEGAGCGAVVDFYIFMNAHAGHVQADAGGNGRKRGSESGAAGGNAGGYAEAGNDQGGGAG